MSESESVRTPTRPEGTVFTRVVVVGGIALAAFCAGFLPMRSKASRYAASLEAAQGQLRVLEIRAELASSAIDSRRGDYEGAREAASRFFTALQAEVDRKEGNFSSLQRKQAEELLAPRDEVITFLARGDPASADRLRELYLKYRKMSEFVSSAEIAASPNP